MNVEGRGSRVEGRESLAGAGSRKPLVFSIFHPPSSIFHPLRLWVFALGLPLALALALLAQAADAQRRMEASEHMGKIVLVPE